MFTAKRFLFAGMAGLCLFLAGCDKSGVGPVSEAELVGRWNYRRLTTTDIYRTLDRNGNVILEENDSQDTSFTDNKYYIDFKADHTYSMVQPELTIIIGEFAKRAESEVPETGTWSVSGSNLTLASEAGNSMTVVASINGSNATFTHTSSYSETDPETGIKYQSDSQFIVSATK